MYVLFLRVYYFHLYDRSGKPGLFIAIDEKKRKRLEI